MDHGYEIRCTIFLFLICILTLSWHSIKLFISFIDVFGQFYLEESKGRVDYQGYIFPRRRGEIVSDFIFFPSQTLY